MRARGAPWLANGTLQRPLPRTRARFEEPGGAHIVGYPRVIEGAVRKPDDRRKRQREAKKERLKAAEEQRREELKRLKNLKKKEIEDK